MRISDWSSDVCSSDLLPDWKALFDCAEAFATPETMPDGRVIDYPADWAARAAPLIEGTGLPFVAIPGGSEGAMMAELKSAYDSKEPLMMMFWAPHWIHSQYEFHWRSEEHTSEL